MSEVSEGELINIPDDLNIDKIRRVCWKTRDGQIIPLEEIKDSHLRNIALFLMDMGYQRCIAAKDTRVLWLKIFAIEWNRRMGLRNTSLTIINGDLVKS